MSARQAQARRGDPARKMAARDSLEDLAPEATGDAAGSKPAARLDPGLYIVATPIGNLEDVTLRALRILTQADVIACEDTRTTGILLSRYGIHTACLPYHDRNAARVRPALLNRLREGQRVAVVSDAGTPLISDPGFKLVREAAAMGIAVVPVPGPSSVLAALVAAGLPTDRFLFAGFLPVRSAARRGVATELAGVPATLIFLESPRRLADSLADLAAVLGAREATVARELTKKFEELRRGTLATLAAHYAEAGAPKGEVVLVVAPPGKAATEQDDIDAQLREALLSLRVADAAAAVATRTGLPRRALYARALELAREAPPK